MEWDERKRARNVADHEGLDFVDARDRFEWETALIVGTHPGKDGRPRFQAIGLLDSDLVSLVFAALGTEAISAISLRRASRAERKSYAQS